MEKDKLKSAIESLLFVSGEPIGAQKLAKICGISKNEVGAAIRELEGEYQGNRGLRIVSKGESYQLATSPENASHVNQLVSGELNADLSRPAIETISIVAYRGPITRAQIEAVRGVNCSYVLRSLLVRGLVERRETADIRGYLYEISFEFLRNLGVRNVKDLPDWENLSKNEKVSELLNINPAPNLN